jgi:hypothetical protein
MLIKKNCISSMFGTCGKQEIGKGGGGIALDKLVCLWHVLARKHVQVSEA